MNIDAEWSKWLTSIVAQAHYLQTSEVVQTVDLERGESWYRAGIWGERFRDIAEAFTSETLLFLDVPMGT
jgi:hypothetical protein